MVQVAELFAAVRNGKTKTVHYLLTHGGLRLNTLDEVRLRALCAVVGSRMQVAHCVNRKGTHVCTWLLLSTSRLLFDVWLTRLVYCL